MVQTCRHPATGFDAAMTTAPEASSHDTVIVLRAALPRLEPLCGALAEALERLGLDGEKGMAAWRAEMAATCPECGILVTGPELLALSGPPAAETASAKTGRLRLGNCARSGCEAYHYLVTFRPNGQVDWMLLLAHAEAILREREHRPEDSLKGHLAIRQLAPKLWRSASARRLWAAVAVALLLLLAREWYRGGTIPLIRQPRHFQVGPPLPVEVQHPQG